MPPECRNRGDGLPKCRNGSGGYVRHASSLVSLGMLFAAGWVLGRYAGGTPWRSGLVMAVTGAALIGAIIALGG